MRVMLLLFDPLAHNEVFPMLPTLFLLVLAGNAPKPAVDKDDLKKLQGTWVVVESEHGGKKAPAKELAKLVVEVSGNKMTTREVGDLMEEASITSIDAKAKPAALDLKITSGSDNGKVVKAIYKLDRDTLTICVAEPGKDRPEAFSGKAGSGHTLLVFKKNAKKGG
jgi:uncharacterized protein (TIGR03067 family)